MNEMAQDMTEGQAAVGTHFWMPSEDGRDGKGDVRGVLKALGS